MSFAINAAPIDNNHNLNLLGETLIDQKKNQFKKTQKNKNMEFNSAKVNAVLENLQNFGDGEEEENNLGNFKPLEPPTSMGVENTKLKDTKPNNAPPNPPAPPSANTSQQTTSNLNLKNNGTDEVDIQSLKNNYMNKDAVKEYFSNLIPNYKNNAYQPNENNMPYYSYSNNYQGPQQVNPDQNDSIINKLNYMINLLEEQQDERTNNVTEEVILYSFLGIFMIFIVDSFARVGKYTR